MRNFISIVEGGSPFSQWRRWWGNANTGQLIIVPPGLDHDGFLGENISDFLTTDELEDIGYRGEDDYYHLLDEMLEMVYQKGWQAILWDGSNQSLMIRVEGDDDNINVLRKITAYIMKQVPVSSMHIDRIYPHDRILSAEITGREFKTFLNTGKINNSLFHVNENQTVCEIERISQKGFADDHVWTSHQQNDHFHPNQIDMFPDHPGTYTKKGNIGKYIVVEKSQEKGSGDREFLLFSSGRVIGYLQIERFRELQGKSATQIKSIRIDGDFTGRGLSLDMYEWVLTNISQMIISDEYQTPSGEGIWRKMLIDPRFIVRTYDKNTKRTKAIRTVKELKTVYEYDSLLLCASLS